MEQSLPSRDYTDPGIYERECRRIFNREWMAVCRAEEVARAGDWLVVELAGDSILVVRGSNGGLNAFHNVCRHRGARLCPAPDAPATPGRAALPNAVLPNGAIRCPYHAWTYNAEGALIGAPFISADADFRREDFSLHRVGCAEWGGFVFLHATPDEAEPLEAQLGAVLGRVGNYPLATLRIGHRTAYSVAANWKIICENYNECYHCGPVHPELCAVVPAFRAQGGSGLNWEDGIPHRDGADTFTWTGTSTRRSFPGLSEAELVRHKGELAYPNLFLSLAREHVAAFLLFPRGPARTDIECLFLFAADEMARADFDHTDATGFWDTVNQQDWAICERVQFGMGSRVHTRGYYAPMEDLNLDMRAYVRARMEGKEGLLF